MFFQPRNMSNLFFSYVWVFLLSSFLKSPRNAKNEVTWKWSLSWKMWFSAREGEKGPWSGVPPRLIAFLSTRLGTSKFYLEQISKDRTLCHPGLGPRLPDGWRQCQHAGWKEQFRRNLMKLAGRDGALFSWDSKTCKANTVFYMALPDYNFILKMISSRCSCTAGWEDNEQ